MTSLKKWLVFIKERHSPIVNVIFAALFFMAHYQVYGQDLVWYKLLILLAGVCIFFFKLRLCDEIKDYEYDIEVYPYRPLPRGAISKKDLYKGIVLITGLELFCFGIWGLSGLVAVTLTNVYLFLMFKEFFVRRWLRPKLILYAVTHTFIVILISVTIFSSISSIYLWELPVEFYVFGIANWLLFNIYEFGRKSFITTEEDRADSYSKKYGRLGAISLVFLNGLGVVLLLKNLVIIGLFLGLIVIAALYTNLNKPPLGKVFRSAINIFIMAAYLVLILKI